MGLIFSLIPSFRAPATERVGGGGREKDPRTLEIRDLMEIQRGLVSGKTQNFLTGMARDVALRKKMVF